MKKTVTVILAFVLTSVSLLGCSSSAVLTEETVWQETEAAKPKKKVAKEKKVTAAVKGHPIVWLGDSLTQGSLGDNNDNLPNAPYEKLKAMAGVPVEGYGFYGYNTHDIFWVYRAESQLNQKRDPNKTYIFWVGSNDWVKDGVPNTETSGVINEIDKFISDGVQISNYIVIGTTARYELGDSYKIINKALKDHYGTHYLDVADVIGPNGYIEDRIHLKQVSYDAVALAVYNKLIAMGYL